jgi:hypothetical protein
MHIHTDHDWRPEHTWVVVVGTLEWKNEDQFDPFPKERRRDAALVRFFEQAGVPAGHIVYLRDRAAHLRQIEEALTTHLAQAQPGDFLFFYYCGHGYLLDSGAGCLACYDAGDEGLPDWEMAAVPALIDQHFRGSHALLAIDSCYSGNLAASLARRRGPLAYACLTSSSASEMSTGNWTFTETLLAGLRGQAFTDSDDSTTITLRELAEQILGDMAFAEEQLASFVTTAGFDPNMVMAEARRKPNPAVGRRVEVLSDHHWYKARIINARGDQFKVHYYGWEDSDDEWVTADQIRDVTPVQYPVGAAVEVRWKGDWYPAQVLDVRGGVHYIKYDADSDEWNEWVGSRRIRAKP